MQHKDPKQVRLERVAHLLMCEVDEAITNYVNQKSHSFYLRQLKQRVEELQALLKL